jgi:hypothetical protein
MQEFKPIEPFEHWATDLPLGRRPSRPLLYVLEHMVLPGAFFEGHPMLDRLLANPAGARGELRHMFSKSTVACLGIHGWPRDLTGLEEAYGHYVNALMEQCSFQTFEAEASRIVVMKPPAPVWAPEALYLALCETGSGAGAAVSGARRQRSYYTLERSFPPGTHCLCQWTHDGKHANLGHASVEDEAGFAHKIQGLVDARH